MLRQENICWTSVVKPDHHVLPIAEVISERGDIKDPSKLELGQMCMIPHESMCNLLFPFVKCVKEEEESINSIVCFWDLDDRNRSGAISRRIWLSSNVIEPGWIVLYIVIGCQVRLVRDGRKICKRRNFWVRDEVDLWRGVEKESCNVCRPPELQPTRNQHTLSEDGRSSKIAPLLSARKIKEGRVSEDEIWQDRIRPLAVNWR